MKKKKIWIALVCLAILMAAAGVFVLTKNPVAPVGGEVNNPSEENSVASDAGSHNFSEEWQADATEHWQICLDPNCTEHTNRGMHSGGEATCTEQAICSICGLPYGEALGHDFESCGYRAHLHDTGQQVPPLRALWGSGRRHGHSGDRAQLLV